MCAAHYLAPTFTRFALITEPPPLLILGCGIAERFRKWALRPPAARSATPSGLRPDTPPPWNGGKCRSVRPAVAGQKDQTTTDAATQNPGLHRRPPPGLDGLAAPGTNL